MRGRGKQLFGLAAATIGLLGGTSLRSYSVPYLPLLYLLTIPANSPQSLNIEKNGSILKTLYERFPDAKKNSEDKLYVGSLFERLVEGSKALEHEARDVRRQKFDEFHFPTYLYIKSLLDIHREHYQSVPRSAQPPLFIGISAPQGCGKTTLTSMLCDLLRCEGQHALSMSLDDFYLTGAEQEKLAKEQFPHNKLLEFRGNAGTHDLALMMDTLHALRDLNSRIEQVKATKNNSNKTTSTSTSSGSRDSHTSAAEDAPVVRVPRYDKSLRQGKGDRAPVDRWVPIDRPVDVVLFEGWMLGFSPLPESEIRLMFPANGFENRSSIDEGDIDAHVNGASTVEEQQQQESDRRDESNNIIEVNSLLREYRDLHEFMDAWLVLAVEGGERGEAQQVFQWRLQAEHQMRAQGKDGLTDAQVHQFVSRFMPAYRAYLPRLYSVGPQRTGLTAPDAATATATDVDAGAATCDVTTLPGRLALRQRPPVLKVTVGNDRAPIAASFIE